jgi:hypothetical protein
MVRQNIISGYKWQSRAAHHMAARKQRVRMGLVTRYSLGRYASSELLLPTRTIF